MPESSFPITKEGFPFILGFAAFGTLLLFFHYPVFYFLGAISFILALFCCYFFRDPARAVPVDNSLILSPGDGRILEVVEEKTPYDSQPMNVVRIFLSVFDVHVQKSPIAGRVSQIEYKRGKFYDARDPKACLENECNAMVIENGSLKIAVKQIAGWVARRIICQVSQGQEVAAGQRLGLIRFGSQVDIYLPKDLEICVKKGDRVESGTSVIALSRRPKP